MPETPASERVRVLYIDDDVALVQLIQRALGRRGFDVRHAANSNEASAYIADNEVDVVALDHYLPTCTGLDFLADLAKHKKQPAVVYVTSSSEMNIAVAALKAGATEFVPKDQVGDDFLVLLASALEQAVEKARLRKQREEAERELRSAKERAETLLAEVNHRVANSLAIVASMVKLQSNAVSDRAAKDALAETEARIYAVAWVRGHLYSSGDVLCVELSEYLSGLLGHLENSLPGKPRGVSLEVRPPAVQIANGPEHKSRRHCHGMGHKCLQVCIRRRSGAG